MPTPAIQRPSVPPAIPTQQDADRREQRRTDHQHEKPSGDGTLVFSERFEDVVGGFLENLGVVSKIEPRAVKPAMAGSAAPAIPEAARRRVVSVLMGLSFG